MAAILENGGGLSRAAFLDVFAACAIRTLAATISAPTMQTRRP
jgi:hypothetical protein